MATGIAAAQVVDDKVVSPRRNLPATASTVYLNAGTNGPLPRVVHEAMVAAAEEELNRGRIRPAHYKTVMAEMASLRSTLAAIIGADDDEVALMRSTTEGLNVALWGVDWRRGDEVLTTSLEHVCLFSPLGLLAQRAGIVVRTLEIGHGGGDVAGRIERAITPRTRAIAISHIQWSTGAIMPLAEIAAIARSRGILTIVDAAQAAGQIPLNMHALGVDAYAFAGQKWLCGPGGTGGLYVRREAMGEIRPTYLRYGAFCPTGFVVPPAGAARYEMGEINFPTLQGQHAGLLWLRDEVGFDWLCARNEALGARCADGLAAIPGVEVTTPRDRMAGLVCFTLSEWHPRQVSEALFERGITIRYVEQAPCPTSVRVSAAWWNTEDEIDRLVASVAELAAGAPPAGQ